MHANNLEYFMKEVIITEAMLLHIHISSATVIYAIVTEASVHHVWSAA
jgi:hypothetical protein